MMELKVDKKGGRTILITLICIIAGYLLLKETERVKKVLDFVLGLFSPFIVGAAIAFILNVPMRFFERKMTFIKNERPLRVVSLCMTLLAVIAAIAVFMLILIPQIRDTVQVFAFQLPNFFNRVDEWLAEQLQKYPQVKELLVKNLPNITEPDGSINWMELVNKLMEALNTSISALTSQAISLVSDLVSSIYSGVFSFIFACYCLAQKETLARQGRKLLYSIVSEKRADEVVRVLRMSNTVFSNFITGQCLDALILGLMCAAVMAILKMPYIPLITLIIVVTALIPVMGALIGAAISAFLIFVSSPVQALIFVIMFIIVQQIDNNIVYPRVVGSSIGLPGMWVIVAVLVGEGLMGVAGMLLMVPFASVLYSLLREFVTKRVKQRNIPADKLKAHPPKLQEHFMFNRVKKAKQKRKEKKVQKKEVSQQGKIVE